MEDVEKNDDHFSGSDQNDIEEWKRIIAELCTGVPDTIIRDCLRAYDPSKPTKQIKRVLNSFNKETISRTFIFLSKKPHGDKMKKDDLLDALIMKVKNYFPDKCQICKEVYCYTMSDATFMECHSCGQEVHKKCYFELLASMNLLNEVGLPQDLLFKIPGIHYLCALCEKDIITDDISNDDNNNTSQPKALLNKPNGHVGFDVIDQNDITDQNNRLNLVNPIVNVYDSINDDKDSDYPADRDTSHQLKEKVCHFYQKGTCKFGRKGADCPFAHPRACRKLLLHGNKGTKGCKLGTKCTDFHPRMCSNSITRRQCFNERCLLVHVKGTIRKRPELLGNRTNESNILHGNTFNQNRNNPYDFLEVIHNFKRDILKIMDSKIKETLVSHHNIHRPPTTPGHFMQPVHAPLQQPQMLSHPQQVPIQNFVEPINTPFQQPQRFRHPQQVPMHRPMPQTQNMRPGVPFNQMVMNSWNPANQQRLL